MKHKLKPTVKTTNFTEGNKWPEKSPTTERGTYAKILKATKSPSVTASKTNLSNYKTNKNTHKILSSLSAAIGTRKQENIPSSNNSNTNMVKHERYQQEINNTNLTCNLIQHKKLLDPETTNLSSLRTDPRTQQIKNEDPRAAFSISASPRPKHPSHLRTKMMS